MQGAAAQNAQYTFKYNSALRRHGWLRLTPAYSVRLVEEILERLDYRPQRVLEPFSGTGTTELVCAELGIPSFALEINPFLVWLANAKLGFYSDDNVAGFLAAAEGIAQNIESFEPAPLPPIHNINRWWNPPQANALSRLKSAIHSVKDEAVKTLLTIAFCRSIIESSNAAFNHVSTSFKSPSETLFAMEDASEIFVSASKMIAESARANPMAGAEVILHDSRRIPRECAGSFDTVITSPPYPNRISYIRELRPYMYWLDYITSSEQAGALDWQAIGGTWGKATSSLAEWKSCGALPQYVYGIADDIARAQNKSAVLMANYVLKYFEDILEHLSSIYSALLPGGRAFYIIGNSSFYGITVPAERIYADILAMAGFCGIECRTVRKRNCNKMLYEFVVSGRK